MHKDGMGYRRISDFLNRSGIKTQRNKTWSNSKVHSNLKRMQEREERIIKSFLEWVRYDDNGELYYPGFEIY